MEGGMQISMNRLEDVVAELDPRPDLRVGGRVLRE
jgi:hypothetical protein